MTKRDKVKNIFYGLIYAWNNLSGKDKTRTVNNQINEVFEICEPKKINKELLETIKEELTKSLKVILPIAIEKEVRKRSKPRKLSKDKITNFSRYPLFPCGVETIANINKYIDEGKDIWQEDE